MFLKAKKKRYLTVTCHEAVLYEGYWTELPLAEEIILEKSIEFFNDKEPCAIHRGAVHLRLWPNWSSFSHLPVSKACSVSTPVFLQIAAFSSQKSNGTDSINIS